MAQLWQLPGDLSLEASARRNVLFVALQAQPVKQAFSAGGVVLVLGTSREHAGSESSHDGFVVLRHHLSTP